MPRDYEFTMLVPILGLLLGLHVHLEENGGLFKVQGSHTKIAKVFRRS